VTVEAGDLSQAGDVALTPTVGAAFTAVVASFTSNNPTAQASSFSAWIDWGNGTLSAGAIVAVPNGSAGVLFQVWGSGQYAAEGGSTITPPAAGGTPPTSSPATAVVLGTPILAQPAPIYPVEGQWYRGVVATFSYGNLLAGASDFWAVVEWGNGDTSP